MVMIKTFLNRMQWNKFLLIISVVFLMFIILPSGIAKIEEKENIDVVWFVDGIITTEEFPIGIYDTQCNYLIQTSWGKSYSGISDYGNPFLIWINTPKTPISGSGTVSLYIESEFYFNKSIFWNQPVIENLEPVNISFKYNWFSFWVGKTFLKVSLSETHLSHFYYEIITNYYNRTKDMPYEEEFRFSTNINLSDWKMLTNELVENQAYNWQSWNFPPDNYTGLIGGMWDGGGYHLVVSIEWNDSTISEYTNYVDNDGGTGERIYSNQDASIFSELLLSISDKYIEGYSPSEISGTRIVDFFSIRILLIGLVFLIFNWKERK